MVDSYNSMFLKKEATYATDAHGVSAVAANFWLTRNFKMMPFKGDVLKRDLDLPARGARASAITNKSMGVSFEVELAGSGAAGTAPAWMEGLEICGMEAPTLVATVSASQKFAALSAALSSASIHGYRGANQRRRTVGVRSDLTGINFTAGAYPFLSFEGTGLQAAVPYDQAALPAVVAADLARWKKPREVSTANTLFTLDGYAAVLRSFVLSANAEITLRNLVGSRYIRRGNHEMKAKIVIEAPDHNIKNYLGTLDNESIIATQIVHGLGAGNIVQVDAANVQIIGIDDSEEGDVAMYEIDAVLTINAGQDDILITAR